MERNSDVACFFRMLEAVVMRLWKQKMFPNHLVFSGNVVDRLGYS